MSDAPARTIERLVPALEGAVQRFVLAHPQHGPGHRRELAAVERALGHRECSLVALEGGEVVGYAPLWAVESVHIRMWRVTSLTGAGLVSCGPLVSPALSVSAQRETLQALVGAAKGVAKAEGAHWLRWVLPPVAGGEATFTPQSVDGLLAAGLSVRVLAGYLVDLQQPEEVLRAALNANTRREIRKALEGGLRSETQSGEAASRTLGDFEAVASTALAGHARATMGLGAIRAALTLPGSTGAADERAAPLLHVTVALGATPLSAVVTCESNGLAYYLLALNHPEALARDANGVALWSSMLSARTRGIRWFLLGSREYGEGKSARISEFKRKFGGGLVLAPIAERCVRPIARSALALAEGAMGRLRGR
jgi:hypothetical protein